MKELLFGNNIEKEALENILALNQIKKCDKEIEKYTNEIKIQNDEMKKILKDEDIDEECVEKIHKYKNLLNNMNEDTGRISELNEKVSENESKINDYQKQIDELNNKSEELKKEIFETDNSEKIIDCQNEIENNNVKLNELNEILDKLISDNTPLMIEREYLVAKNSDYDFNIPNYNKKEISTDLEKLTKEFNDAIERLDLPIRENIEFCQKKIKNREIEIDKFNKRKSEVMEAFPDAIKTDISIAMSNLKDLLGELDLTYGTIVVEEKNIFDEEPTTDESEETEKVEETVVEEPKEDIKDEISSLDNEEEITEATTDESEETKKVEEEVIEPEDIPTIKEETTDEEPVVPEKEEEIGSVSYVLSDGESLANIAEKVYPSKDNWEAIYYFNKDAIDKYLVSNGISNDFDTIKELSTDTSLFTGIKLEIPTDYNYKI